MESGGAEAAFAVGAIQKAMTLARLVREDLGGAQMTKKDLSPVTVADYAIQALVAEELSRAFPGDALVGEEDSAALRDHENLATLQAVTAFLERMGSGAGKDACRWIDCGKADAQGRFWTVDPIDGTKGYLRGGQYAVALALVEDGYVQVGALGCPELALGAGAAGLIVVAERGGGCWRIDEDNLEKTRVRVSQCADVSQARVLRSYETGHTNVGEIDLVMRELGITAEAVAMDSQAKYAVLASGAGELLFRLLSPGKEQYKERIWDQAAGCIVVEEAGGRVTDLHGKRLDFSCGRGLDNNTGVFASNGLLHDRGLEALRAIGLAK